MFSSNTTQVSNAANYIEDVFSTYLYTGTGASQTITNGIDLSTKGGMVWVKSRSNAYNNAVIDTDRGMTYSNYRPLFTNLTDAQGGPFTNIMQANADGFSYGTSGTGTAINSNGATYVSWTFRKQPKFFDVVTYTGTGNGPTSVSHSLGSTPGFIVVKRTNSTSNWFVWHRGGGTAGTYISYMEMNSTAGTGGNPLYTEAAGDSTAFFPDKIFDTGSNSPTVNGATYVAYLFAHNAGGFGLTGTDNVISCGSYTGTGTTLQSISLGYEPQFVLCKVADDISDWVIADVMRGMSYAGTTWLYPSGNYADDATTAQIVPTATGFNLTGGSTASNGSGKKYIYIAIRRGPMKVPTSGTSVFTSVTKTGVTSVGQTNTTNFPVDLSIDEGRATNYGATFFDRLRGSGPYLNSSSTAAEANQSPTYYVGFDSNTSVFNKNYGALGGTYVNWLFRRAPSFFDEVCYTGTGSARNINHNLGVAPQMMIVKSRSLAGSYWYVYYGQTTKTLSLNIADGAYDDGGAVWNSTAPTSTVFSLGTAGDVNGSGYTYVNYLFATCAGVSKVGSYTGNDSTPRFIDCGFTGGARFVLLKCTSQSSDWYVWDSARGMTSTTAPYLALNSTAAQTASTYIQATAGGFTLKAFNSAGDQFIFLAIA